MDEKYLQNLYDWIVSKDPSYKQDVTPEAFRQKMTDPSYVSKMHGWISSLDPTFQRDMTIDKFNERVGLGKKKADTGSFGEGGSLEPAKIIKPEATRAVAESTAVKPRMMTAPPKKEPEKAGYLKTLYDNLALGASYANEAIVSLPETVINLLAVPQNFIAEKTGWNIGTNADQVKKQLGIRNPLLDWVQESQKVIKGEVAKNVAERYNDPGIVSNFQKGNYQEGFELLGAGITQSIPISIGMMMGGAYTTPAKLAAVSTLALTEGQRKELEEMDPTMKESEKMIKALGMAGAESFFESIGTGTIGRAYRDIAAKEGTEAAKNILKDGLVTAYKKALEKSGAVAGFAGEGLEEAATQITQNVISGKPTFEGVADAFVTGAGSGVVFTAPMSVVKAKQYINNKVETYKTKDKIGEILGDKADDIDKLYNVPVASEITKEQIEVANLPKSRDILVNNLKKAVSNNTITENDAKQSLFVFDKIQQVSNSVKDLGLSSEDQAKVATLLKQRDELKTKIQNKDDVLVVQEKQQIEDINNQIQQIIIKSKEDAVQKQAAGQVPVQPTPGVSKEVEGGKPQPKPEGVTAKGIQETVTPQVTKKEVEVYRGTTTGNKSEKDGVSYYTPDRGYAAFYESGVEKPENKALQELQDLKEPTKPTENTPISESDLLLIVGDLGYKFNSASEIKNRIDELNSKQDKTLKERQELDALSDYDNYDPIEVDRMNKVKQANYEKDLSEYNKKKSELESKAEGYLSPKKLSGNFFSLGIDFSNMSPQQIFERLQSLGISNEFKGGNFLDNYHSDLVEYARKNDIDFYDGISGGIVGSMNTKPQEIIEVSKITQPTVTRVKIAPFFNTQIASTAEAAQLRQSPEYKSYLDSLNDIGAKLGVKVTPIESIGGYENEKGEKIVEISNDVDLENATIEQAEDFAALASALAPQVQEAAIAAQYLNQEGGKDHRANEYTVVVSDVDGAIDALKIAGISDFSINEKTGEVSFIDVLNFTDPELQKNIGNFLIELESKGIKYEQQDYKPLDSRRIGKAKRKGILGRIKSQGAQPVEGRQDILPSIEEAVRRDAEFQGVAVDDYFKPRPGNRLFNKPLEAVAEIADRYFQRVFGKPRPKYYGSKSLDEARAKRISDAFDAMKHDPNNPEVKAAYEALAKETLDQYKEFSQAGYKVEINNNEPYANSQEMIDDLRNNKRMKIFSTESGFGDTKITDKQRKENPLLRDSGFKDVNGKPLLINDVFRAIHDFYGHAELGNSFGPKGEENAWNVHARMFSPEARKAMTTETRGQNSYVNFSGVNDKVGELRQQARDLREEGLYAQARKKVEEIYDQISFADQKVGLLPEEFYQIDETDLGDADRIPEAEVMEEIGQELTESDLPGYDRMMGEIDGIIEKSQNRGVPFNKIMDNAMEYMKQSKAYENATDVQREALVRDLRSRFKKREKRAPTVKKILGQEKTMVTVDDYKMMVNQIKMEVRAAREAKADLNTKRRQLTDFVRKMAASGKIPVNRVAALINRIGKVNLDSNESVERFVDYAGKLFADADYANKLSAATTMRSQIRKLSKNKDKAANLRDLGTKFAEIDPSMVEDIDEYNRVASLIKESIKGSTTRGANVKFANMVKEADAIEYINATMEAQQKKLFDMKVAEVQELLGVDASELSYDQLMQMLESKEPLSKDNEKLVRSAINKAFDIYSTLIKESMRTGKDLFTGEDVDYTANQKKVVKEFMDMDLNLLKPKQALEAVDALMNFFQNQSVAKMESVVAKYRGEANAAMLEKKGIKAKPIRKYWSKGLGRLLIEQAANLNILFERMFGGFNRGGLVEDAIGVTAIKNGKSEAQTESNSIVKRYVDKFYKTKPNGKDFNTAANNTERGMVAFMMRNVIGTEAEMQAEFDRRKNLILKVEDDGTRTGSIAELEKGNDVERERAKVYQEVYDKILADSNSIDEVVSKADKTNVEAVNFWQNEWDSKYEELSDVALGVYNKVLGKDINYNPDRFSRLSSDTGDVELSTEDMTFIFNSGNAPIYKKETGVLMTATRPESLPRNEKNGEVNRYVDLSFDSNNANSMYDALVDIKTAAPIRQVESALNSSAFKRIAPDAADRKLLENRVKLYVNNIRKKNPFSNDEFSKAVKGLNRLASIGVGQALGGVLQPIKQVVPIAMNTMINAGGLDIGSVFNKSKQDFINKSGYAIANRGVESQAQVNTLNKMIDEAANSKPEQAFRAIEKINNWWLKNLLVRFDVAIARASWMTYYEQALEKQGINTKGIDYSTHEINQEAADYAQRQVDRQQNVSDADLAGALLSSKDAKTQLLVKVLMPFASFRMNQSARLGSDLATLLDKTTTKEDRAVAARSLGGFAAEMVTFRALSAGSALLIASLVKEIMGREDDEEKDKKKMDAIMKGQLTSTVADVFSPAPFLDKIVQLGASSVLDATQDALDIDEEERLEIYSGNKQDLFQSLGLLGIAGSRANQLWEMTKLSMGAPYEDDYGRKKYLSEQDRDAIGTLIPFAIVSNLGLVPSEVNSIIRSSLSDAKRGASTVEGGKSKEDVSVEKRSGEMSAERKAKLEESKQDKITALEELRNAEVDSDKLKAIDDMISELSMTAEEKKEEAADRKKEKLEKAEKMKELLKGYDNKTDMKRYDPELYEETFGENSEYYLENKAEMEVEKELNKKLQEMEDEERGYTPAQKRKLKYRNRLKSFKSKYKREYESKSTR